jgi:hypothetical protein
MKNFHTREKKHVLKNYLKNKLTNGAVNSAKYLTNLKQLNKDILLSKVPTQLLLIKLYTNYKNYVSYLSYDIANFDLPFKVIKRTILCCHMSMLIHK